MAQAVPDKPVRTRLVLMFPGFERVPLEAQYRRFVREADRTAPHYGVTVSCSPPRYATSPCSTSSFQLDTLGEGWSVRAEIVFYGLADLNSLYDSRPWPVRFWRGLASVAELLLTGAAFRYLRDGWRFFLFFLFPFVFLAGAFLVAYTGLAPSIAFGPWHLFWSLPAALIVGGALMWFGKRLHLPLMMDLWAVTVDVARHRRPDVDAFIQTVADDAARRILSTHADEVVLVGHSFGVVPAVMALADQSVLQHAQRRAVGLLAAGSYLLAVVHHPAAVALRGAARRIMHAPIAWLDAQSHTDPVNFFRTNPADALDVDTSNRPSIVEVRFKNQLTPKSYRAIRGDFFRTHRQFVFGVERRSHYALFAMIGGPERFSDVTARRGLAPDWRQFAKACQKSPERPATPPAGTGQEKPPASLPGLRPS